MNRRYAMYPYRALLSLLCLLFYLPAAAQAELVPERILLTFIPNIQFAPMYVGIEQGHFAEAGFDVTLEHLQEPEALDLVAISQAKYSIVSGEQVILARSRGRDVVYVFEWFQQYPIGIVYDEARALDDLAQLRGWTIGIPIRSGASYSGLTALLHSVNLTEADVVLQEIGFNAPEAFCLGAVDAAVIYANNEALHIRRLTQAGECGAVQEVAVAMVADEVDLVSNGLIVNRDTLQKDPHEAAAMVQALRLALRSTIDNPAAAYLASLQHVDTLPQDEPLLQALEAAAEQQHAFLQGEPTRTAIAESRQALAQELAQQFDAATLAQFQVLLHSIELWDADELGISELASWQSMQSTLDELSLLGSDLGELENAFSNELLRAP